MELHNLIQAVEGATTPNRGIDGDVIELLNLQPDGLHRAGGSQPELFKDGQLGAHARTWLAPRLMGSFDAVEELLPPSWRIRSLTDQHGATRNRAILEKDETQTPAGVQTVVGYGCTRAAAMLAACLRAKACDRGSPMPPSSEFATDDAHAQCVEDDRPTLKISAAAG